MDLKNDGLREQRAEIERLRAALVQYGEHTYRCDKRHESKPCTCGWDAMEQTLSGDSPPVHETSCAGCARLDKSLTEELENRDRNADYADQLTDMVGILLEQDMGEHSNMNEPWENAIEALRVAIGSKPSCHRCEGAHATADCPRPSAEETSVKRQAGVVCTIHGSFPDFTLCPECLPKASTDRAAIDASALADAHRMYEAEHGEPFQSKAQCPVKIHYPGGESHCIRDAGHDGNCLF